jgi:hypothetical protein
MALKEPFAAYDAAHNVEAEHVRDALLAAGIEARLTEDIAAGDASAFGLVSEVHKPQVWIERADVERAAPIFAEFGRRAAELRAAETAPEEGSSAPIELTCEECGGALSFPAGLKGSVQECTHCGAYVDVGDAESEEDWGSDEETDEAE